jgi:hypothetical protein
VPPLAFLYNSNGPLVQAGFYFSGCSVLNKKC